MPRFYFHAVDGSRIRDTEGLVFADEQAAWKHAATLAGDMLINYPEVLRDGRKFGLEVTDDIDATVYLIHVTAIDPRINDSSTPTN